jgi:serine/threonine protein kinase
VCFSSHLIIHISIRFKANILVNSSEQACISDFGLTSVVSDLTTMNASTSQGHERGTCRWMAPELFDEGNDHDLVNMYSAASDIYSLAMVIFEVCPNTIQAISYRDFFRFSLGNNHSKNVKATYKSCSKLCQESDLNGLTNCERSGCPTKSGD